MPRQEMGLGTPTEMGQRDRSHEFICAPPACGFVTLIKPELVRLSSTYPLIRQTQFKVAVHLSFQGSGGGSGRRCCARQQLRARESSTRWCHPASPRPGDSSTSRQEGSPPYSIQPDCWCSVACAMLLLEVVDRGAEVEVVLPVPTTVLWRRF